MTLLYSYSGLYHTLLVLFSDPSLIDFFKSQKLKGTRKEAKLLKKKSSESSTEQYIRDDSTHKEAAQTATTSGKPTSKFHRSPCNSLCGGIINSKICGIPHKCHCEKGTILYQNKLFFIIKCYPNSTIRLTSCIIIKFYSNFSWVVTALATNLLSWWESPDLVY